MGFSGRSNKPRGQALDLVDLIGSACSSGRRQQLRPEPVPPARDHVPPSPPA